MADRAGQQLGNYRLERLIGQGGFADVYLGVHIHLNTLAAIKVLQLRLVGSNLEQFRNEARVIAALSHPHIVRVLDFGVDDGIPYLVMEYAPNGTLRQRHPKGAIVPPAAIVPYVKQAASALQYAHDQKLIHRDIKPENMLLGRNNEVLLSDFGLVLIAQSTGSRTTQEMSGTVPYMAPEQLQGRSRPASDQYSLGVVVYEWLSGERPFNGTFVEIASQHMLTPPAPLYGRIPGIAHPLEQVVMTALAKDPQQRFVTIQAFATAFEHAALGSQRGISSPDLAAFADASSQATFVRPSVSGPTQSPTVIPPISQSSLPTVLNSRLNQGPQSTVRNVSASSPSQPTYLIPASDPSSQSTVLRTPANPPGQTPVVLPLSDPGSYATQLSTPSHPSIPPGTLIAPTAIPQPEKRGVRRRTVLLGLLGVVALGGTSLALLGPKLFGSSSEATPTPQSTQNAVVLASPDPHVKPDPDPKTDPNPATNPDPQADPDPHPQPDPNPQPDPQPDPEPQPDPVVRSSTLVANLGGAIGCRYVPGQDQLYFVEYGGNLSVLSGVSSASPTYQVLGNGYSALEDIVVTADGSHAYVTERGGNLLYVNLANANRSNVTVVSTGINSPQQLAIDEAGGNAYVVEFANPGRLLRINLSNGAQTTLLSSLQNAIGLLMSSDFSTAYITEQLSNSTGSLSRYNLNTANGTVLTNSSTAPLFYMTWANAQQNAILTTERDPANNVWLVDITSSPASKTLIAQVPTRPSSVARVSSSNLYPMLVCCNSVITELMLQ